MKTNQTLYGFWDYDLCPYMLCGEIDSFNEDGTICPKGYQGSRFRPIGILPELAGKNAKAELEHLKSEYARKEKALRTHYRKLALSLLVGD